MRYLPLCVLNSKFMKITSKHGKHDTDHKSNLTFSRSFMKCNNVNNVMRDAQILTTECDVILDTDMARYLNFTQNNTFSLQKLLTKDHKLQNIHNILISLQQLLIWRIKNFNYVLTKKDACAE